MARNLRAINRFGSKVLSAHRYPPPRYRRIREPFAGGAGYSLLHHQCDVELLDLDEEVIGTWEYLIKVSTKEVLALPLIQPGQDVSDLKCSEGGRLLISWCLNQTATPRRKLSSWGEFHAGRACFWGAERRRQSALICERVKHWRARVADYREATDEEADWFIDPPYVDGGKNYKHSDVDYGDLAEWCRARKGQVIVCERVGATWLPFQPLYKAPTSRRFGDGRTRCEEAVWIRGQSQTNLFEVTSA